MLLCSHNTMFNLDPCIRHFTYYLLSHEIFWIRIMYWARIFMASNHIHSDWVLIVFLSKKGSLSKINQMQNPLQQISFLLQKVWMQQFYFVATSYCHNSISYQYILLLQKLTDVIVVNNIDQYVVAAFCFCCELAFGCKTNCCHHIYFCGNIIYYN